MDLLILAGLFLVWLFLLLPRPQIKKCQAGIGVLHCYLIYSDQKTERKAPSVIYSKLLSSKTYELYGKPDYVFKHRFRNFYIPIELKSGRIGDAALPHDGDLMQLAAYFLIVSEHFGAKVPEGRLIYSDATFIIRNTRRLRKKLLRTVNDMRTMLRNGGGGEAEANYAKCRHCVCNGTVCEIMKQSPIHKESF